MFALEFAGVLAVLLMIGLLIKQKRDEANLDSIIKNPSKHLTEPLNIKADNLSMYEFQHQSGSQ